MDLLPNDAFESTEGPDPARSLGGSGKLAGRARRRRARPDRDATCLSAGASLAQGRPCPGVQPAPSSETSLPASSLDPPVAPSPTLDAVLSVGRHPPPRREHRVDGRRGRDSGTQGRTRAGSGGGPRRPDATPRTTLRQAGAGRATRRAEVWTSEVTPCPSSELPGSPSDRARPRPSVLVGVIHIVDQGELGLSSRAGAISWAGSRHD